MFNNYETFAFKRVTKTTAKKLFNDGKEIFFVPCKANINSMWFSPYYINKNNYDTSISFESLVNNFEYYNCNNKTGRYTSFYVYC